MSALLRSALAVATAAALPHRAWAAPPPVAVTGSGDVPHDDEPNTAKRTTADAGAAPEASEEDAEVKSASEAELDRMLLEMAEKEQAETVVVWGERPNKPFDRDTELRLTGPELARRGVANLGQALEYIPEIQVRDVNRGGQQIDVRGARKGSVKILIDGVPVGDPYRGNFDVSSIPVTDIVEIRVSTSPASPIDGTGGPGGVVEIHTRDAVGSRWMGMRADVNTLPQTMGSASARTMLSQHVGVRVSATGDLGGRDLSLVSADGMPDQLDEDRRAAGGSLRAEYRRGTRRAVADFVLHTGSYVVPPSETESAQIVWVDRADDGRFSASADDELGGFRMQLRGYTGVARRRTFFYRDADLEDPSREDLDATSMGGAYLLNRPVGDWLQLLASTSIDTEHGEVTGGTMPVSGRATLGAGAIGTKLEHGMLRIDGAVGAAVPLDIDAAPWPEAKLAIKVTPVRWLTPRVVGGYKGRLPNLRERFENGGNQDLGPEKALFAEVGAEVQKNDLVSFDVAGFVRRTNGMIRLSPTENVLINAGEITMRGMDARVTALPYAPVRAGGSLSLIQATSEEYGDDAVDRLPGRRGDVWVAGDWSERLGGVVRYRYTGVMVDQEVPLDDYWLLELSSWFRVTRTIMGSLRVDNALDERYLDRRGGIMGTGRVVMLSAQGEWE